jgi:hypothetical protein
MVMAELAWPTWLTTHLTSNPFARRAIEMYVQRTVCGVVLGSGGRPRSASRSSASVAASRRIVPTRWRVVGRHGCWGTGTRRAR